MVFSRVALSSRSFVVVRVLVEGEGNEVGVFCSCLSHVGSWRYVIFCLADDLNDVLLGSTRVLDRRKDGIRIWVGPFRYIRLWHGRVVNLEALAANLSFFLRRACRATVELLVRSFTARGEGIEAHVAVLVHALELLRRFCPPALVQNVALRRGYVSPMRCPVILSTAAASSTSFSVVASATWRRTSGRRRWRISVWRWESWTWRAERESVWRSTIIVPVRCAAKGVSYILRAVRITPLPRGRSWRWGAESLESCASAVLGSPVVALIPGVALATVVTLVAVVASIWIVVVVARVS